MKFGLDNDQYRYMTKHVVAPLQEQGARVFCYGSRARGDHQPYSDLDIMVESSLDLSTLVSFLQEQVTNSNFPYKVDLVEYRDFADSYKAGYQKDKLPW